MLEPSTAFGRAGATLALAALAASSAVSTPSAAQQVARGPARRDVPVTSSEITLPELGLTVRDVRTLQADGRYARLGYGPDEGVVDVDALRRADHALGLRARGKLSPSLAARIAQLDPEEPLEVAFWLVEPDASDIGLAVAEQVAGLPEPEVGEALRAARVAALSWNEERCAPSVQAVAELVRAYGGTTRVEGLGWPLVIAELPAGAVRELAASPLVDVTYISQPRWFDENEDAQGTMRTPTVHEQGVLANGSVKVLVNDTGNVQQGNPWLPPVTVLSGFGSASHATGVAGNIAGGALNWQAAAYTLPQLYTAAGTGDVSAPNNWQAGMLAGIDFGNCSWWNSEKGQIAFLDRFFDYTIRNFSVMLFKSAGNQGGTASPYTTTPGNGYNMIASGAYSDGDDVVWSNDQMADTSSFWNPAPGHEKPELASPGTCVLTTGTGPGGVQSCFGGTSSASPLTCGVATLIASGDNTLLTQMTTVKASLLASAWHNVEGAALLSDKDGAGSVHAAAAYALVRDQQWWFSQTTLGSFPGGVLDVPMPVLAGDETRVVAAWFSRANSAFSTDVLDMDLDLAVLDPTGTPVASAASALDPFELASFVPAVSGTYTVRLTLQRFDGTSEPLTVAWSSRSDTATARIALAPGASFAVGETASLLFEEPYTGAGKPYIAWVSFTPATGQALPGGYSMPVDFDALSWGLIAHLPGFLGTMNASGTATMQFPLPPEPFLEGWPFRFGLLVLQPGATFAVETLAPPLTLVVGP